MSNKDLYGILGIPKTATEAEIKSAYRKLARKYHPDVNKDSREAADRFREISAAYEILQDKEKRKKYDDGEIDGNGRPAGFGAGGASGAGFRGPDGFDAAEFDFSDIFGGDIFEAFGGGGRGRRPRKGQDVSYTMPVYFLEAALGSEKTVPLMGKNISVRIPPGAKSGQTLRLRGLGRPGLNGGASGDVLITLNVGKHPYFSREEDNILLELPVSIREAVNGAKITVPTIHGKVAVGVPPYSSSGDKLRLKGKGIKGRGDQIISLRIVSPARKNKELEEVLGRMDDEPVRSF
jgi:DnaJ-class molecular chaperone